MRKLFVFVLLCWSLIHAEAQTISLSLSDVSLSEALRTLNNATSIYVYTLKPEAGRQWHFWHMDLFQTESRDTCKLPGINICRN